MARTKKQPEVTAEEIVDAFAGFLDMLNAYNESNGAAPAGKARKDADDEDEDEGEEKDVEILSEDDVNALGIVDLRTYAASLGIDAKKKADIFAALEKKGYLGGDEEEDEDDEEEVDLEEMSLVDLRKYAKSEEGGGFSSADVKGKDQDELIEMIEGAADEDEDEDEDEDDEDEEDSEDEDEDEDTEVVDEDSLKAMSLPELKELAGEIGLKIRVPRTAKTDRQKKKVYVDAILDSGEEEE